MVAGDFGTPCAVGNGFHYTPTTCFLTFPFPHASPVQQSAVAEAARELNELRQTWLNPPEDTIALSELEEAHAD